MERSLSHYTTTPKNGQNSTKNRSLLVHIDELSTAVVKVDIKVINASLTKKSMFTMCTAGLNAC